MNRSGRSWHGANSESAGLASARLMYGPGYRCTLVRSKPDPAFPGRLLVLVAWVVEDQGAAGRESERRFTPLSGAAAQAASYLA